MEMAPKKDCYDNIIVADTDNHLIRNLSIYSYPSISGETDPYDTNFKIATIAGTVKGFSGDGRKATFAKFNFPFSVTIDRQNNVLIADTLNHRVRRISHKTGEISTIAGGIVRGFCGDGLVSISSCLSSPVSLAIGCATDGSSIGAELVAAECWLYIADYDNNRIRRVAYAATVDGLDGIGVITSFVNGAGTYGLSGEGGLAINAHMKR